MKKDKVCISKSVGIFAVVALGIIVVISLMTSLSQVQTSTSTRASVTLNEKDCNTVTSGTAGVKYYQGFRGNKLVYYKDANGRYEITEGVGKYCKETNLTAGTGNTVCRDVRMDVDNCIRPLFQKGNDGAYYTNSLCMGRILKKDGSGAYAVKADLQGAYYCGSNGSDQAVDNSARKNVVPLKFDCPDNIGGLLIFYYKDGRYYSKADLTGDVTDRGVGNMCKEAKGNVGYSAENTTRINCGTLGGKATKFIAKSTLDSRYFYDVDQYRYSGTQAQVEPYCRTPDGLNSYLNKNGIVAKVECGSYQGGDPAVSLYVKGDNSGYFKYYKEIGATTQYVRMSPENICSKVKQNFSCSTLAGSPLASKKDLLFGTVNEVDYYTYDKEAGTYGASALTLATVQVTNCGYSTCNTFTKEQCVADTVNCTYNEFKADGKTACGKCAAKTATIADVCP